MPETAIYQPPKGTFPRPAFLSEEEGSRLMVLIRARRRQILTRHIWERREEADGHASGLTCKACGFILCYGCTDPKKKEHPCTGKKGHAVMDIPDVIARYPSFVAHLICTSLGYCTPSSAARIILDYLNGRENWCEWIYSCYNCKPRRPIEETAVSRHTHKGYMADYHAAIAVVGRYLLDDKEPLFASWF